MKAVLGVITLLLAAGVAQAQEKDQWDELKPKDRVIVRLNNKNTIQGHVYYPPRVLMLDKKLRQWVPDPKKAKDLDFKKEKVLWINASLSFPSLGKGAILSFKRENVHSVRILRALSEADLKKIKAVADKVRARADADEAARKEKEAKRNAKREAAIAAAREALDTEATAKLSAAEKAELEKALAIYQQYPPPTWGPHKLESIAKRLYRNDAVSRQDAAFQRSFALWIKGRDYVEEQKKKSEEIKKKEAEKKKEEEKKPGGSKPPPGDQ